MLLFFVWCRGYCFKRQLLFLLSGKPSSFTSPEMKAKSRLWECSLKTPLKRDCYHHKSVWELHFPCFPLIRAKGVSVGFFLVEEQRQTVLTKRDVSKFSLSVVVHWVPHSVGLHCSDSVCLPDYLKVSLLHRASRIILCCSGPLFFALHQLAHKLYSNSLKAFDQNLTLTSCLKIPGRDWSWKWENKTLVIFSCKKR